MSKASDFLPFLMVCLLICSMLDKPALIAFGIMLLLKLIGVIAWSWWIIFIPLYFWIPVAIFALMLDFVYIWAKKR